MDERYIHSFHIYIYLFSPILHSENMELSSHEIPEVVITASISITHIFHLTPHTPHPTHTLTLTLWKRMRTHISTVRWNLRRSKIMDRPTERTTNHTHNMVNRTKTKTKRCEPRGNEGCSPENPPRMGLNSVSPTIVPNDQNQGKDAHGTLHTAVGTLPSLTVSNWTNYELQWFDDFWLHTDGPAQHYGRVHTYIHTYIHTVRSHSKQHQRRKKETHPQKTTGCLSALATIHIPSLFTFHKTTQIITRVTN